MKLEETKSSMVLRPHSKIESFAHHPPVPPAFEGREVVGPGCTGKSRSLGRAIAAKFRALTHFLSTDVPL